MRGWLRLCNLLPLAYLLGPSPSAATTVRYLDLPALVARADLIVLGTCVGSVVAWEGSHLVTLYEVEVHEAWRGDLPQSRQRVRVVTLGGILGGVGQQAGDPVLPLQKPLVLHLRRDRARPEQFSLVGAQQGIWHVTAAPGGLPTAAAAVRQERGSLQMGAPEHRPDGPATLGALRQAVRELAPHAG